MPAHRLLCICAILFVLATILACGAAGSACYSQYEGCEEHAILIATASVPPTPTLQPQNQ